MARKEDR